MKATVHFNKIKYEIIENLRKAKKTIKVAVAWFTDEDIIRVLTQQKVAGIDIEVIISNAKENFENTDNFKNYLRLQAKLFVSNKSFMHHKFCIIDNDIIINGSYNWSYAARTNEENILVLSLDKANKDDEDLLKRFEVKYKYLSEKCSVRIDEIASLYAFSASSKDFGIIQSQIDEAEILLRQQFENDIKNNIETSVKAGIPLSPNIQERMIKDGGGVEFVKRLLHDEMTSGDLKSGFRKLEEQIPHRVDLSFEYLVSRPQYEKLFTSEEVEFCKKLMAKYNL